MLLGFTAGYSRVNLIQQNMGERLLDDAETGASSITNRARGMLDDVMPSEMPAADRIFRTALDGDKGVFFRHLNLRSDGGLDKPGTAERLYSIGRLVGAASAIFFVFFNMFYVFQGFAVLLRNGGDSAGASTFLLLIDRDADNAGQVLWMIQMVISGTEVLLLSMTFLYAVGIVVRYSLCTSNEMLEHYHIYFQLNFVCIGLVPMLGNFSALKLLNNLNPQLLASEFATALRFPGKYGCCGVFVSFTLSHVLFGALGFLAFVVKLSQLVVQLLNHVDDPSIPYGFADVVYQVVVLFGFVNQLFGFSQVTKIQTDRVGLLLFGGEEAAMKRDGVSNLFAYLAAITHMICTDFYKESTPKKRKLKRAVAMLTFSHVDVQYLVLDEKKTDADIGESMISVHAGEAAAQG